MPPLVYLLIDITHNPCALMVRVATEREYLRSLSYLPFLFFLLSPICTTPFRLSSGLGLRLSDCIWWLEGPGIGTASGQSEPYYCGTSQIFTIIPKKFCSPQLPKGVVLRSRGFPLVLRRRGLEEPGCVEVIRCSFSAFGRG
jgi:hypothetical protein